jgi:shikimate kinase
MREMTKSLDEILADFDLSDTSNPSGLKSGGPVTIWLPAEFKERYDRLQKVSDRKFCKKVREALKVMIELAEKRVGAA